MSFGTFFLAISAILLLLIGFHVVDAGGRNLDLVAIALGLIPLGLIFDAYPINWRRP